MRRHFRRNKTTCPLLQMFCFRKCSEKKITLGNVTWNKYTKIFCPPSTLRGNLSCVFVLLARTWGLYLFVPLFFPHAWCLNKKKRKKVDEGVCVCVLQVHALHKLHCIYLFVYVYKYIRKCMYICVCVCVCVCWELVFFRVLLLGFFLHEHFCFRHEQLRAVDDECVVVDEKDEEEVDFACLPLELFLLCCCCCKFTNSFQSPGGEKEKNNLRN